ncbi:DNA polymerase III subunit alpha [Zavarzinia sp. CC-PAN008]|uniref:DNA polymerase III subunit alpha n=1 Tax=Zavarzinia sp. CC-PAN008 TaxID=3243332 RepID=UPI003F7480DC
MPHSGFVHLHVHSAYSLSEGAIPAKELVALAAKDAQPAVAITDTNNLFGALELSETAVGKGVQPIMGCQLALAHHDAQARLGRMPRPDPVVLLAMNPAGWLNLMALTSHAFVEIDPGLPPHVTMETLAAKAEGLILLTGGPDGPIGRLLADGQGDAARVLLQRLAAMFKDRCYVEVQRHGLAVERRTEGELLALAYDLDLPLVATNDCYFARAEQYDAHDALLCIAEGTTIAESNRRRLTAEHRFKTAAEMKERFADLPEAIDNTLVIARRCAVRATTKKPILPRFPSAEGVTEAQELYRMSHEGLQKRLVESVWTEGQGDAEREATAKPYRERLDFELSVIEKMGFPGYFLIVADFIQWTKAQGIPVGPGRGSGAGSAVAWALTITDLDPLRFGLLFERFLNPERVSMPDFDIDFCQDRRDEVIRYVQEKYGSDRVAQIITFGKLQARAALRDVGRVMGMPYGQVHRLAQMVPNNPANPVTLADAIKGEPRFADERAKDEKVGRVLDTALLLEGLYRNASTHAAGVVIGDRPLSELVPLYRDPRAALPATQFNMKWVEQAGLVKFDFLGLKTLTVLQKAVELLALRGVEVDLARLPLDDKASYDILGRGETVGIFQLESSGMRDALRKLKPDTIGDIIAMVALYRPGPMANIPRFIAVKQGLEEADYLYPTLEPVLKETYGVIVYQEQVMQIAQILAGYSLGEADLLRRAMGKKIQAEMDAQRERFVRGAVERGVAADKASEIFDLVDKFAGYGFNKSHAAAYAIVAYQTAWLKANHPVEFLAASMSLDLANTDKLNIFRQELERLRIPLRQPDINRSDAEFTCEWEQGRGAVRYALAAIKTVGRQAADSLVADRKLRGPYRDLGELARRLDPRALNKRTLENLAKAGALDGLEPNRARGTAAAEWLIREAGSLNEERSSGQAGLFGDVATASDSGPQIKVAPWDAMTQLSNEFEAIGFYLSAHPLDAYQGVLKRIGAARSTELMARAATGQGKGVRVAGTIISKQERTNKQGNRYAFASLSDQGGTFEVTFFSEILAVARPLLEPGTAVILTVNAEIREDTLRLTVNNVERLDAVAAAQGRALRIFIEAPEAVTSLRTHLKSPGACEVSLVLPLPDGKEAEIRLPEKYDVGPRVQMMLKTLPGIVQVQDL